MKHIDDSGHGEIYVATASSDDATYTHVARLTGAQRRLLRRMFADVEEAVLIATFDEALDDAVSVTARPRDGQ